MTTYELTKQRLEETAVVLDVIGMAIGAAERGEYELDVCDLAHQAELLDWELLDLAIDTAEYFECCPPPDVWVPYELL